MNDESTGAETSDELLRSTAAARYLGGRGTPIAETTMRQWRYRGYGPPYSHVGKFVVYRRSDLDAWLEANRIDPEAVSA
jgi:hypothetical protein